MTRYVDKCWCDKSSTNFIVQNFKIKHLKLKGLLVLFFSHLLSKLKNTMINQLGTSQLAMHVHYLRYKFTPKSVTFKLLLAIL